MSWKIDEIFDGKIGMDGIKKGQNDSSLFFVIHNS